MRPRMKPAALKQTRWHEYAIRFLFGGLVTLATGLVARRYGPEVGGLFLAFPAIFPAALTLVQKHEDAHERRHGHHAGERGINAAGVDAAGTALGSFGLAAFGLVIWLGAARLSLPAVLACAAAAWVVVAFTAWAARQRIHIGRAQRPGISDGGKRTGHGGSAPAGRS